MDGVCMQLVQVGLGAWSVQVFVAQMHGALRAAAPTLAEAAK